MVKLIRRTAEAGIRHDHGPEELNNLSFHLKRNHDHEKQTGEETLEESGALCASTGATILTKDFWKQVGAAQHSRREGRKSR